MGIHGISWEFTALQRALVVNERYMPLINISAFILVHKAIFLVYVCTYAHIPGIWCFYPMLCHMAALAIENKAKLSTSSAQARTCESYLMMIEYILLHPVINPGCSLIYSGKTAICRNFVKSETT